MAIYKESLDEDGQVEFKGKAKAFVCTYGFLSSVLPYSNASWEKLSIFLNFLIPKLSAPKEEDPAHGLLETMDMDSYRAEKRAAMRIALADESAEIGPVPTSAAVVGQSRNWTGSPASCRHSMSSSVTSTGRTRTGCGG